MKPRPTGSAAGSAWPAASAFPSVLLRPRSSSSSYGAAIPVPPPSPGALCSCFPASGCAPTPPGYVKKNQELTVTGPYAHVRNPLYLGSILMAAGFAVALGSWAFAAALAIMFVAIYVPVIVSEERFLRSAFSGFSEYCRQVPRLIPRLTPAGMSAQGERGRFFLPLYLKHREYNALLGAILLYLSLFFLRPALSLIVRGRP